MENWFLIIIFCSLNSDKEESQLLFAVHIKSYLFEMSKGKISAF